MFKKLIISSLAVILTLIAGSVWAQNSVGSSTMIFQGTLTNNGDGTYSGYIPMLNEATLGIGDNEAGFDVYAKNGATAWFGDGNPAVWTSQNISSNDAWPGWDPDTPDWYQYSLNFYLDGSTYKWALRNHAGATVSVPWYDNPIVYIARGVPMSGCIDWVNLYACESDVGAYLSGTGTPEIPGGAATKGGGAGCWDMDWSWGSEVVPLQHLGFDVTVSDQGGGVYRVTFTPVQAPVVNSTTGEEYCTIQSAIDDASAGDVITVSPGIYTEAIVINKSLTVRGATYNVNKNGYTVPPAYAWDPEVESIINHPTPTVAYNAIVDIVDVSNVTFEGFVVQEQNAVGNLNTSLVRIYANTKEVSNTVVRNNVIGPNTNTTSQDGTHGRMGLYIVNNPYSDDFGVVNSTFSGNKIFDCRGNGNNIFIWSSYYAYGAAGPASMSGTVIEDNEICGAHRSGIETAGGFSDLTIRNNKIYNQSSTNGGSQDPNLKYGHGILLIRGASDKMGNAAGAYGPVNLTIEDNDIYDNEKSGIYMDAKNTNYTITGNDIYDNGYDGIMLDLEGLYWNGTFEPAPDPPNKYALYNGTSNISANHNNIYSNGDGNDYGIEVRGIPTNGFVMDAKNNWWGHISGPYDNKSLPGTPDYNNPSGTGDAVTSYVDYNPWSDVLIPVELTSFTAAAADGVVVLEWVTQTETENFGYHVYRSLAAEGDYAKITDQIIKGAGSSAEAHTYTYTDRHVQSGKTYYYKLCDVDYNGNQHFYGPISVSVATSIPLKSIEGVPAEYSLGQNYPNPFNPETAINFSLKESGYVSLKVYNVVGQVVRTLVNGEKSAGSYSLMWNGADDSGTSLTNGIYYYSLQVNGFSDTKKLVLMK